MCKFPRTWSGALTIALSVLLAACSTRHSEPSNEHLLRATVPPGVQSPIAITTKPMATCVVVLPKGVVRTAWRDYSRMKRKREILC